MRKTHDKWQFQNKGRSKDPNPSSEATSGSIFYKVKHIIKNLSLWPYMHFTSSKNTWDLLIFAECPPLSSLTGISSIPTNPHNYCPSCRVENAEIVTQVLANHPSLADLLYISTLVTSSAINQALHIQHTTYNIQHTTYAQHLPSHGINNAMTLHSVAYALLGRISHGPQKCWLLNGIPDHHQDLLERAKALAQHSALYLSIYFWIISTQVRVCQPRFSCSPNY